MKEHLKASRGWAGLTGLILAYECLAPRGELLSEGVDRALEKHPIATTVGVGYIACHLLNLVPPYADPIHLIMAQFKPKHDTSA